MDRKRMLRSFLKVIVSLGILLFILFKVDFNLLFEAFESLNWFYVVAAFILLLMSLFVSGYCVFLFIPERIRFDLFFKSYLLSWSYGLFLPGRLGEFSIALFLKKYSVRYENSIFAMILDKLITVFVLILFSLFVLPELFSFKIGIYLLVGFGILVLVLFIIFKEWVVRRYMKYFGMFRNYIKNSSGLIIVNFLLTIFKWIVVGIAFWFIFRGFGFSIDLVTVVLLNMAILLLSSLPITISGWGIREGAAIVLYGPCGLIKEVVLACYLIVRVFYYLLAVVLIGSLYVFKKEKPRG
ncbi:MAG: lysylphosphatidylglycerol synthase transmembrane domain-containing protein [Candidatus Nanoarchaeia archaeon]|nr:lysylphosphatidylglycerol synthase transmembrane domain-containing protein [Candidatus Nanoarchaeia archaeon]